jgi:hypothetical protein
MAGHIGNAGQPGDENIVCVDYREQMMLFDDLPRELRDIFNYASHKFDLRGVDAFAARHGTEAVRRHADLLSRKISGEMPMRKTG